MARRYNANRAVVNGFLQTFGPQGQDLAFKEPLTLLAPRCHTQRCMSQPHLEHPTVKVRQLIDDYRAGRILIPEFQREYVWKPNRAQSSSTRSTEAIPSPRFCSGRVRPQSKRAAEILVRRARPRWAG